jgi:hypothetical protein
MAMCSNCGNSPRMVSKSGNELSRCEDCQRAYWRQKKQESQGYKRRGTRTRNEVMATRETPVEATRTCKECHETKPIEEFPKNGQYRKTVCKGCYATLVNEASQAKKSKPRKHGPAILVNGRQSTGAIPSRVIKPPVLFVDRVNNQFLLCVLESEVPMGKTTDFIIGFYQQLGYRVVDAVELKPEVIEAAGD